MEADTISTKNGRRAKSQMSRFNFILVIVILFTVMFSLVSFSSSERIPNGNYVCVEVEMRMIINGNNIKITDLGGSRVRVEGTYELVVNNKDKNGSRGHIIIKCKETGETRLTKYVLEGNKITFQDDKGYKAVYIKI